MNNKKSEKSGRMTIDKLAVIMKAGFDGVNKKFSGVNKKFGGLNKKIDNSSELIDKLAVSTLNNFVRIEAKMATKEDFNIQQATLKTHHNVLQIMLKEITAIHGDTKSFRDNIATLYTDHVGYDRKISNLGARVEKLELKSK